jgi:benzoylformate decarboxylase
VHHVSTILQRTYEILRAQGMRTIFGNPGSNELPFLAGMPDDFDYVLGLHEGVVLGMADGYAQATGRPVFVNLHAASGTGNAMGALTNAHYAHSPLVILAGQQIRSTVGQEAMLSNVDAALLTRPLVKYSHEPLSPQDVPRAVAQAGFEATTAPAGPVYLSVPYDDWAQEAMPCDALLASRSVRTSGALGPELLAELVARIDSFERPVLVLGPEVDVDLAQDEAVALAERLGAPVWVAPSPPRCPFPTRHPHFRGVLPPGITSVRERLEGHDGVIVLGAPVMRYHRWEPGAYLPQGTQVLHLTSDPGEATRAPYGEAIVGRVGAALAALAAAVPDRGIRLDPVTPPVTDTVDGAMTGHEVLQVLNDHVTDSTVYVNETTTLDVDYLSRIEIDRPGMYHFPASGGLGFGLPAAVGIALAKPEATVVATVGDGSANYGITALYTAAQRRTRTVFVIVNNSTYGALRGFAARLDALNAPGLDVPGIDFVNLAAGYGVPASRTTTREEFEDAYVAALAADGPVLIDARVAAP